MLRFDVKLTAPGWLRRRFGGRHKRRVEQPIGQLQDRVYEELYTKDLSGIEDEASFADDLLEGLRDRHRRRSDKFLDFYSQEAGEQALERYGFLPMLRERGFDNLLVTVDLEDDRGDVLRIHFDQADQAHLLVELVLRRRRLQLPDAREPHEVLSAEWLVLQDPRADFSAERPALPYQRHPGLGLFRWVAELLRLMATRLDCAGLMNYPAHYHNAVIYGRAMKFVDPLIEGRLRAMERDLATLPLHEATVLVDQGRVCDADGHVVDWHGKAQVLPIALDMQRYFEHRHYRRAVRAELERTSYRVTQDRS